MSSEFGLSNIAQIAIVVKDPDRAVQFYQQALGMKLLFRAGQLSFFDAGNTRLMLSPAEKPEFDHPSSILYFKVPDIQQAHTTLASRGVKFEDQPHLVAPMPTYDLWMCFFRDSEANFLALMAEVPKA